MEKKMQNNQQKLSFWLRKLGFFSVFACIVFLGLTTYQLEAKEIELSFVKEQSAAQFFVLNKLINEVEGEFEDFEAKASFDDEKLSSFLAKAMTASINTQNSRRDKHLRNADFFEVESYQEITLSMLSANPVDSSMKALLSIKDFSQEIDVDYKVNRKNIKTADVLELILSFAIDRREYELGKGFAAKIIAHEVKVVLTLVFSEEAS